MRGRGNELAALRSSAEIVDPFAVNPIRRSFALVVICASLVFGPFLIGGQFAVSLLLGVGWISVTGLIFGIPILIWSLIEEAVRIVRRQVSPGVDQLDLSPRLRHVLTRYGYTTIASVDQASDVTLLLLSNLDERGLHEIRRSVSLWKYRRWQEAGFPATGYD
jgi:hypothetical protein